MIRSIAGICALVVLAACTVSARTWYILPDGTGDAPTIQAGIDSAASSELGAGVVVVASGTYYESGIRMRSGVILESETGNPEDVTIDAQRYDTVIFGDSLDPRTVISGITLIGGLPADSARAGGGIRCRSGSLVVSRCVFRDNAAMRGGGAYVTGDGPRFNYCTFIANEAVKGSAVYCDSSAAVLYNCTLAENRAEAEGTVFCSWGSPHVTMCTFYGNSAGLGSALYSSGASDVLVRQTLISYGESGGSVGCGPHAGIPTFYCTDIFGNAGGDWVGCIAYCYGVDGNFSACPSFCDAPAGDFGLCNESFCLPGNHPDGYDCPQIGAWEQGCVCGPTLIVPTTWGSIKSMYR
jgi:hypothetical protein